MSSKLEPVWISIEHDGERRPLATIQGVSTDELSDVLRSVFSLERRVVGLEDMHTGLILPLSLLSVQPERFDSIYSLLLQSYEDDEEDDDEDDGDAEQEYEAVNGGDLYLEDYDDEEEDDDDGDQDGDEEEQLADEDQLLLRYIQDHTAFSKLNMAEIMTVFRDAAGSDGLIDKRTFEYCFDKLLPADSLDDEHGVEVSRMVADRIFDVFDKNQDQLVNYEEFVAGLSVLCRASSGDKIEASFKLFDLDGDGYISLEEMQRYLTAFFSVCFSLESGMQQRFGGASAEDVGKATAEHCFQRADTNGDGLISLDEFKAWYTSGDDLAMSGIVPR